MVGFLPTLLLLEILQASRLTLIEGATFEHSSPETGMALKSEG